MFLHQYNYRETYQRYWDEEHDSHDNDDDYGRGFNYDEASPSEIGDFEAEQAHGMAEYDQRDIEDLFDYCDQDEFKLDEFANAVAGLEEAKKKVALAKSVMDKRYSDRRERERLAELARVAEAQRARYVRALGAQLRADTVTSYVSHKH